MNALIQQIEALAAVMREQGATVEAAFNADTERFLEALRDLMRECADVAMVADEIVRQQNWDNAMDYSEWQQEQSGDYEEVWG